MKLAETTSGVRIQALTIGILMIFFTGVVFFSTTLVYTMMLVFSFLLLLALRREKCLSFLLFYGILYGFVLVMKGRYTISGWTGSLYTMALIFLKLYPLWILASILSDYETSTMIHSLRSLRVPNAIAIGVAVFFRFLPEYRAYLVEIQEGLKVRRIEASLLHPVHTVAVYLVPMIYKAFETGEMITCALVTKGFEYDCQKTSYEELSFSWQDYGILFIGCLIVGMTRWQRG